MTARLYYQDPYGSRFEAKVLDRRQIDGRPAVILDQTAFFPGGGGQPADHGWLNDVEVLGLVESGELVWHLLASPLDATQVQGQLNWTQRWDHMQNHTGQHILSQAFVLTAQAPTVSWHLSPNSLTIDLSHRVGEAALAQAEALANQVIWDNRPVRDRLVQPQDLPALNLRKQPDVEGPLRIVEIAGFDRVACSGTHVAQTAEVGLIKVLRAERRGTESRIHFVCGGRALADYGRKHRLTRELAERFSRAEEELLEAVDTVRQEALDNHRRLKATRSALVEAEAARLLAQQAAVGSPRLVCQLYPDWQPDQVKQLALHLGRQPGIVAALGAGEPVQIFLVRSQDVPLDAAQILRAALAHTGGRGGGRPTYAQGQVPSLEAARRALQLIAELADPVSGIVA